MPRLTSGVFQQSPPVCPVPQSGPVNCYSNPLLLCSAGRVARPWSGRAFWGIIYNTGRKELIVIKLLSVNFAVGLKRSKVSTVRRASVLLSRATQMFCSGVFRYLINVISTILTACFVFCLLLTNNETAYRCNNIFLHLVCHQQQWCPR